MNIGLFVIPEGLSFPRTHAEKRHHLRSFARSIDLDLRFVHRKKTAVSYCDGINGRAVVAESLDGKYYPIAETISYALHECAHWMDLHNGLYRDYYARRGYKHVICPLKKDIRRLGVRAERHCDWVAARIMWVMYGRGFHEPSVYDNLETAREMLTEHYKLE